MQHEHAFLVMIFESDVLIHAQFELMQCFSFPAIPPFMHGHALWSDSQHAGNRPMSQLSCGAELVRQFAPMSGDQAEQLPSAESRVDPCPSPRKQAVG